MRRLALLLLFALAPLHALAAGLLVEFLDVGQGDAILVTSPTGKHMLVDGGPPEAGSALVAALRRRDIRELDLLVITHPHLDHVGGLLAVLKQAPPKLVLDPGIPHPLPSYDRLLEELEKREIPVRIARAGRRIELGGGAVAELLAPEEGTPKGRRGVNERSVVLQLRYGSTAVLLAGDAEASTERELVERYGDALRSDLLKVAHHGSKHSSRTDFLRAVGPRHAVISCGKGNVYGHPAPRTVERLAAGGARVHRTDRNGTIRMVSDGKRVRVTRAKEKR